MGARNYEYTNGDGSMGGQCLTCGDRFRWAGDAQACCTNRGPCNNLGCRKQFGHVTNCEWPPGTANVSCNGEQTV